jgi:hypothetical protein
LCRTPAGQRQRAPIFYAIGSSLKFCEAWRAFRVEKGSCNQSLLVLMVFNAIRFAAPMNCGVSSECNVQSCCVLM